jgi:hypothetical protein
MRQGFYQIPHCRCLDILLAMDDHELHLVDQNALDLRHIQVGGAFREDWHSYGEMKDITPRYVDGDKYAFAALHCISFLSKPP